MAYCVVKADNCQNRFGQGQDNFNEKLERVRSIQLCRLFQRFRNAVDKIGPCDDDIVDGNGSGNDHCPEGICQVQVVYHQVSGNQAAAEIHRQHKEEHQDVSRHEIFSCQRISGTDRQDHVYQRTYNGIENGIAVANPDISILGNSLVGDGSKALR